MIIVRYLQLQNRLSVKNLTSDMNFDGFPVCVCVRNMFYHLIRWICKEILITYHWTVFGIH